jgi:formylglycine-generating enzyme required for sulfatase activity
MAGNVAEWVADAYLIEFYAKSPAHNSIAEDSTGDRVYRGGSFGNPDGSLYATSYRCHKPPSDHDVDIGFRCAMSTPKDAVDESVPNNIVEQSCMAHLAYNPNGE